MEEQHEEEVKPNRPEPSARHRSFLLGIVVIVLAVAAFGVFQTKQSLDRLSDNETILNISKALNLSIAEVDDKGVPYIAYIEDLKTLKKFYSAQPEGFPAFTDEQISDQVLSRLVVNVLIGELAEDYDVEVEDEDLDRVLGELLAQFPSEAEAEADLMSQYGWSLQEYTQKVVRPLILEQKLQEVFVASDGGEDDRFSAGNEIRARHILFAVGEEVVEEDVRKSADAVLERLKAGEDFATLALEFGSDGTKDAGGDLGWFGKGLMVPEFEEAAFALESGQLAEELVKTQFGFHIVQKVDERKARNFGAFMDDAIKSADIDVKYGVNNPFAVEDVQDLQDAEEAKNGEAMMEHEGDDE